MIKVYYNLSDKEIISIQEDLKVVATFGNSSIVICDISLLDDKYEMVHLEEGIEESVKVGWKFPLDNVDKLKEIAYQTIDYWVSYKQTSGYTDNDNITWSTSQESRMNMLGKITEMQLLQKAEGIFPDIHTTPHTLTLPHLIEVGSAIAQFIENIYLEGEALKTQVKAPTVTSLDDIENILSTILEEIK